jgi:hypothetical protein
VDNVNPSNSTINCGHIIDAVLDRLTGKNSKATAPNKRDGSFGDIGKRHGTKLKWGKNFDQAFDAVKKGGNGTTAIVGIKYKSGASHVVVMTNRKGKVQILEAQDWGKGNPKEVITTPKRAKERYGKDSEVGYGIVP